MLRADVPAIVAALDAERDRRGLRWADVATELSASVPTTPAMLTRLRRGGRVSARQLVAYASWLRRPVAELLVVGRS